MRVSAVQKRSHSSVIEADTYANLKDEVNRPKRGTVFPLFEGVSQCFEVFSESNLLYGHKECTGNCCLAPLLTKLGRELLVRSLPFKILDVSDELMVARHN